MKHWLMVAALAVVATLGFLSVRSPIKYSLREFYRDTADRTPFRVRTLRQHLDRFLREYTHLPTTLDELTP